MISLIDKFRREKMSTPLLLVFKKQPNYLIAWVNHDGDSLCSTFKETKIEELERLFDQLWEYRNNSKVYVSSIITNDSKGDRFGLKYDVCLSNLSRFMWEENTDFIGSFRYGDDLTKVSADKLLDVYYNITERYFFNDFSYYCIIDLDKERVGSSGDYKRVPKMVRCGRKSNFDGKGFGARDMKNNIDYYDIRKSRLNTDYEDADSFDESYNMNESYSDLIRSKIFDVGHKFGLDVYGTDDGGIVFENENMPTSDDEELLVSLEKFENSIIIKYNDEDNVVVYLKDNLDDIDESKKISRKRNLIRESSYDGKYYVDIEDEDEDALYSSDIEFNSKNKAVSWAYDELEKNQDNDDVYQASIYQMFINDDGDLDHELMEVIHKEDLD